MTAPTSYRPFSGSLSGGPSRSGFCLTVCSGSFLFWKVQPQQAGQFAFYDFLTDYHERNNPYAPKTQVPAGQGVVAILDGQQRLTALNIGLYGSHAERQPRRWVSSPGRVPQEATLPQPARAGEGG